MFIFPYVYLGKLEQRNFYLQNCQKKSDTSDDKNYKKNHFCQIIMQKGQLEVQNIRDSMEFMNMELPFKKEDREYCLVFHITIAFAFKNRFWVLKLQSAEIPTSVLPQYRNGAGFQAQLLLYLNCHGWDYSSTRGQTLPRHATCERPPGQGQMLQLCW